MACSTKSPAATRRSKSSSLRNQESRPSSSPARGCLVVADTASSSPGTRSSSPRIRVPLPTPDGPVMTRTGVSTGRDESLPAQVRDELVALALGQAADRLAGRDAAVREDAIYLHAPVLGNGQKQVEDLGGLEVVGRV